MKSVFSSQSLIDENKLWEWMEEGLFKSHPVPAAKVKFVVKGKRTIYIEESLSDHVKDVLSAYHAWVTDDWLDSNAKACGVNKSDLNKMIERGILLHDIGKATKLWQKPFWNAKKTYSHALMSYLVLMLYRLEHLKDLDKLNKYNSEKAFDFHPLHDVIPIYAAVSHHSNISSRDRFSEQKEILLERIEGIYPIGDLTPKQVLGLEDALEAIAYPLLGVSEQLSDFAEETWRKLDLVNQGVDTRLLFDVVRYAVRTSDRLGSAFWSEMVEEFIESCRVIRRHVDAPIWKKEHESRWAIYRNKNIQDFVDFTYDRRIFREDSYQFRLNIESYDFKDFQKQCVSEANSPPTKGMMIVAGTGMGKTVASHAAALEVIKRTGASRITYAAPTRLLGINKFEEAKEKIRLQDLRLFFQDSELYQRLINGVRNELADDPEKPSEEIRVDFSQTWIDNTFNRFYTITTPDQLLKSWHGVRSLAHAQRANLTSSVIILDEIHSYEGKLYAEILEMIRDMINHGIFIILLSATLPDFIQEEFLSIDGMKGVINNDWKMKNNMVNIRQLKGSKIPYLFGRKSPVPKKDTWSFENMTVYTAHIASLIIDGKHDKVIIYCNLVDEVQALTKYLQSNGRLRSLGYKVIGLHARFTMKRRAQIEHQVLERMDYDFKGKTIVVMNQAGIVGLDISSHTMISKPCWMDMKIQQDGRNCRGTGGGTHYITGYAPGDSAMPYSLGDLKAEKVREAIMLDMYLLERDHGSRGVGALINSSQKYKHWETQKAELDVSKILRVFNENEPEHLDGLRESFTVSIVLVPDDLKDGDSVCMEKVKTEWTVPVPIYIAEHLAEEKNWPTVCFTGELRRMNYRGEEEINPVEVIGYKRGAWFDSIYAKKYRGVYTALSYDDEFGVTVALRKGPEESSV